MMTLSVVSLSLFPLFSQNDAQIQELFMKIDYSGQGSIEWVRITDYIRVTDVAALNQQMGNSV